MCPELGERKVGGLETTNVQKLDRWKRHHTKEESLYRSREVRRH